MLEVEIEAYQKIDLYVWIFVPIIIVMTIMQFAFFTLYNGQFHPMNKILILSNPGKNIFNFLMTFSLVFYESSHIIFYPTFPISQEFGIIGTNVCLTDIMWAMY